MPVHKKFYQKEEQEHSTKDMNASSSTNIAGIPTNYVLFTPKRYYRRSGAIQKSFIG